MIETRAGVVAAGVEGCPMSLKSWYAAMQKTWRRKMVLSNLIFDLTEGGAQHPHLAKVLRRLSEKWTALTNNGQADSADPHAVLLEAVAEVVPDVLCCGREVKHDGVVLSRVTRAIGWYENTVASPAAYRDEIPDDILREIDRNGLQPHEIRPGAEVRGLWPEAWVTVKDDLDEFIKTIDDPEMLASRICDFLGLIDYIDGQQIIRIDYPDDALAAKPLVAPTVIDGCSTRVFRSMNEETWGMTVNLAGGKGAREAVHPSIPFTSEFQVRYLERIEGRTQAFVYRELVKQCPRPWEPPDEQEVDSLL